MHEPSWRHRGSRARAAAPARAGILLIGALAASAAHAKDPGIRDCPDVSGHYRVVQTVEGPSMAEALQALHAGMANFIGSEVRLEGPRAGRLLVWVKSGGTGVLPPSPSAELKQGSDFSCVKGWVKLAHVADSSRRLDEGWYEGRSTAAISRAARRAADAGELQRAPAHDPLFLRLGAHQRAQAGNGPVADGVDAPAGHLRTCAGAAGWLTCRWCAATTP